MSSIFVISCILSLFFFFSTNYHLIFRNIKHQIIFEWIQCFGMKPFISICLFCCFFFLIPEVWACRFFLGVLGKASRQPQTADIQVRLPPYYVTFHWVSLGAIVDFIFFFFFLLAVALAYLWISKGAVHSSSLVITYRPVAIVEVTFYWWMQQIWSSCSEIFKYFLALIYQK